MAYVQEIQGVRAEKKNVLVVEFDALVGLTVESYSYTHLTPEDARRLARSLYRVARRIDARQAVIRQARPTQPEGREG